MIRPQAWVAGLLLGLGSAASSSAQQELPPVFNGPSDLPPVPIGPGPTVATPPIARPAPPVVEVPLGGDRPFWRPSPVDPVALERKHMPGAIPLKSRSWHWRRLQGKFWGYPEEYEPRPLGAALYEAGKIETANGAAARLVLYRYDFLEGSTELSPRGLDQLAKLSAQLCVSPYPLIIERIDGNPSLAESRRFAVLARLARGPYPALSDRVLVGVPMAHGLSGSDAQIIAGNALGRTQAYGPPIPINANGVNSPSGVTSPGGSSNITP